MKAVENGFRRIVACSPGLKAGVNENKKGTGRIIAKRAMQLLRQGQTCGRSSASLYQRSRKGRFRSGQTGQTVNLLALRLRWFESSPAHFDFRGTTQPRREHEPNHHLALRVRSPALIPKTPPICVLLSRGRTEVRAAFSFLVALFRGTSRTCGRFRTTSLCLSRRCATDFGLSTTTRFR